MSKIKTYGGGFLGSVVLITAAAMIFLPKKPPEQPQPAPQQVTQAGDEQKNIMLQIAKTVSAQKLGNLNIDRVEVSNTSSFGVTYSIWYKKISSFTNARDDTTALVRSSLQELKERGLIKREEPLFIHAHAYQEIDGETRKVVRKYGTSSYDFNKDRIVFELGK